MRGTGVIIYPVIFASLYDFVKGHHASEETGTIDFASGTFGCPETATAEAYKSSNIVFDKVLTTHDRLLDSEQLMGG
jgi:hypothetical protein